MNRHRTRTVRRRSTRRRLVAGATATTMPTAMSTAMSTAVSTAEAALLVLVLVVAACTPQGPGSAVEPATGSSVVADTGDETGWWSLVSVTADGTSGPVDADHAGVDQTTGGPSERLRLPSDLLHFETDSAEIGPEGRQLLAQVARILLDDPDHRAVAVVGHTDGDGSDAHNQTLGASRAAATRAELEALGVPAARLLPAESRGESCPIASNHTPAGRALNRRVELLLDAAAARCPTPDATPATEIQT